MALIQHLEVRVVQAFKATTICTMKLNMQSHDSGSMHPSSAGWRSSTPAYTLTPAYQCMQHAITKHDLRADNPHTFKNVTQDSATSNGSFATRFCPLLYVVRTMRRLYSTAQASTATSVSANFLVQLCKLTRSEVVAPSSPTSDLLQMLLNILKVELHEQRTSRFVTTKIQHANEAPSGHSVHQSDSCNGKDGVACKAVIALDEQAKEH